MEPRNPMKVLPSAGRLEIYIGILQPYEGRFYHWTLAVSHHIPHPAGKAETVCWKTWEVARTSIRSPFAVEKRIKDPQTSHRCRSPLTHLSSLDGACREDLFRAIDAVPVRRNVPGWDCQSYVKDIVERLVERGYVDEKAATAARLDVAPFAGRQEQDFAREDRKVKRGRVLSDEFVDPADDLSDD